MREKLMDTQELSEIKRLIARALVDELVNHHRDRVDADFGAEDGRRSEV